MAYMNQERKTLIAAALKPVVPAGWKYSLAVRNHMTIVMTVTEAPFNLIGAFKRTEHFNPDTTTHVDVNPYHYSSHLADECVADVFSRIFGALNTGNHDNSDLMTDYFDVGFYVDLHIGRWDKPFAFKPATTGATA